MAKAKTKVPHELETKIALPPRIARTLLALEREKQELHAQGAAKEREQIALLTGIVAGAGGGEFDPLGWDTSKVGEGYIARIVDAKGKPVEVLGTMDDVDPTLPEHAETSKPTLVTREVA